MSIIYKTDLNEKEYLEMLELWNNEMGKIYPYNKGSFYYNVLDYNNKRSLAVFDEETSKLVGFIILKEFHDDYLTSYEKSLFIHLFYVSKKYRHQGIGSKLIEYAKEERSKMGDEETLQVGKEIGNFAPGIPSEFDNLTDNFLEKRGFKCGRYTHDLISHHPVKFELTNKEIQYIVCDEAHKQAMIQMIENNNWKRWAYEAIEEFKADKNSRCYIIGLDGDKVVSFCKANSLTSGQNSYNMMWKDRFDCLGGIGPLGVDKEYRKQHLGGDVVKAAINYLVDQGVSDIIIDWTGIMEFYQKYGFEVFKQYKYTSYEEKHE